MELKANVNFNRFEAALQVVDAHTEGEFCRMVIGGFPEPQGNTMIEKKKWMEGDGRRWKWMEGEGSGGEEACSRHSPSRRNRNGRWNRRSLYTSGGRADRRH